MKRVRNILKKIFYKIIYSTEFGAFVLVRMIFRLFTNKIVEFGKNENGYFVKEGNLLINIAIFKRFRFYHDGLKVRLNTLAEAYGVHLVKFQDGDVVIDCGANIGELGSYLQTLNFKGRYVAVEPDDNVNPFCAKNNAVFPDKPLKILLSDSDSKVEFFLSSSDADSSAIKPESYTQKIVKDAKKLDSVSQELGVSRIKLFKLEAEGYEPEVLRGSLKALEITKYVAIDCGPERYGKDTIVDCFNVLYAKNFKLVFSNFDRGSFLFENTAIS